jgi:hypothetical protein
LELGGEPGRDLVAAVPDGVLLIRRAEDAQLALTGEAEQVQEIQGALLAGGAVLDGVGDREELAELGAGAAGDRLVDPVQIDIRSSCWPREVKEFYRVG